MCRMSNMAKVFAFCAATCIAFANYAAECTSIRHPSEVLKVGQVVTVYVKDVDVKKNRIGLTMKKKNK